MWVELFLIYILSWHSLLAGWKQFCRLSDGAGGCVCSCTDGRVGDGPPKEVGKERLGVLLEKRLVRRRLGIKGGEPVDSSSQ